MNIIESRRSAPVATLFLLAPLIGEVLFGAIPLSRLPFGLLGSVTHAMIVRKQLLGIFRYRRQVIGKNLGWARAVQEDVRIARL